MALENMINYLDKVNARVSHYRCICDIEKNNSESIKLVLQIMFSAEEPISIQSLPFSGV